MSTTSKTQIKKDPRLPPRVLATFAKYQAAREALGAFMTEHSDVLEEYMALQANHNSALGDAKKAYELNTEVLGPSYAGFSTQGRRSLDVERLIELMPEALGFVKIEHKLPLAEFDKYVAANVIPDEIHDEVVTTSVIIKGPAPV